MSLQRKIILLFCVFAIIPLLALAGFSYWHAQDLMKGVVRGQLQRTTEALTADLRMTERGIEGSLETLLGTRVQGQTHSDDLQYLLTGVSGDSLLERAAYVGLRDGTGPIMLLAGAVPADSIRCVQRTGSRLVTFTSPPTDGAGEGALEAAFWMSDLASLEGRTKGNSILVVDTMGNLLLSTKGCHPLVAGVGLEEVFDSDPAGRVAGPLGSSEFRDGEGVKLRFVDRISSLGWTVVIAAPVSELLGPLRSLTLYYWVIVLALGVSTALAFSIIIRRYTMALSELARAAEEIGLGELDPWLPLSSPGELGALTMAFSHMLERIRRMMNQVNQSGRLAVVGQLSAYLAHEIRNPLTSIKLNLQRLLRWTRSGRLPEFCLEPLEISIKEVERLGASVTGVLQLSKTQDSPREVVGLHGLLGEAADLVGSRFKRQNVGLSLCLDAEADLVLARAGQLKSVALNLMVNALEAQPSGGRLEILSTLSRMTEMAGPVLSLHFKDAGPGVPADIRDRIFEPFFTTKSGGAGIGLAMAKQSVEDNGGQLLLSPSFSRDEGAEFVVVFPLAPSQHQEGIRMPGEIEKEPFLLTPEGLKTVLHIPFSDTEEMK